MGIYWNRVNLERTVKHVHDIYHGYYGLSKEKQLLEDTVVYIMKTTCDLANENFDDEYARNSIHNTINKLYVPEYDMTLHAGNDPVYFNKSIFLILRCNDYPHLEGTSGIITGVDSEGNLIGTWGEEHIDPWSGIFEVWNDNLY